ncbi:MAG: glycosyltransferase 87 family protein [Thermoleophilia bacterium]
MRGGGRARAVVAVLLALTALLGAAGGASAQAPGGAQPSPAEAARAAGDIVRGVAEKAGEIQDSLGDPVDRLRPAHLTDDEVTSIADTSGRLHDWIDGREIYRTAVSFDSATRVHTVFYVSRDAAKKETVEAQVLVSDDTGEITEVRTGPQVAWMMARGYSGAFGRGVNEPVVWITLCALFLLPLLPLRHLRRLLSMRTLDLAVLLSFSVSLIWFNEGEIFTSVPLQYPPLVYLALRLTWIAVRRVRAARPLPAAEGDDPPPERREGPRRPTMSGWAPTWLLATILIVALALRFGLNAFDSNVIDVGYAGVIGADRITHGETPYGTMPKDCGSCDTYGPLNYIAYVPFELVQPWSGGWDSLPAAHGAATLFDVLCVGGLLLLGWRLASLRLGLALAVAWAAFPFTAYALETNSNDSLVAALLIWGLVVAHRPMGRGLLLGLALATKFAPAILLALWSRRPFPRPSPRRELLPFVGGLALSVALTVWVLLLDGGDGIRAFWSRTIGYQLDRDSPFSLWGQYPGLRPVQIGLMVAVMIAALAVLRWPRRLDLLTTAALSGALLIGIELTVTHWFYLYIPWFLPFALLAIVPDWPAPARTARPAPAAGPAAAETPPEPLPATA